MKPTYDPLEFIGEIELFTIAVLASFVTWKLLNAIYDNIYEPVIDVVIDSEHCSDYYVKIGKYYVQMGTVIKDIIKWIIIIIFLMILYNIFVKKLN